MIDRHDDFYFALCRMATAVAVVLGMLLPLRSANAQVNVAAMGEIIDGSGAWQDAAFNGGDFPASRVLDGSTNETEGAPPSYWLGREGTLNEYFTLDLGEPFEIDRIDLFNTHNRQFNDRGTDEFVVYGALDVDGDLSLVDRSVVLSGNLSNVNGLDIIPADSFPLDAPVNVRYLQFEALTANNMGNNVGLNEFQAFSATFVPDNRALGKPIIDGSGSWDGGEVGVGAPFDGGSFPATSVTDGSTSDAAGNFWLGREGTVNEYFTLDLETTVNVQEILLRNTHNSTSDDRGTREFRILAANSIDDANQLVDPVEILQGSLPNSTGITPTLETVFTVDNGLSAGEARYLRFESLSSTYFNDQVGLNEIEVYDSVMHEPTEFRDNIALGKPIIDGSGSWDGAAVAPFDGGTFPASRVTDGSQADAADGRSSYWLAPEFCPGEGCVAGETDTYFTLDLGDLYTIDEIDLRNTHNRQFNDRGTDEFVLFAATEVDENNQLVNPVEILRGNLTRTDGQAPIIADVFTSANGLLQVDARYLRFQPLSPFSSETNGGAGLNEIEVYGTLVPEPSTHLIFGTGLVFLAMLRRRRFG